MQTLSDRPSSAAEMQQTLDSALLTLRPKSSKNNAIFKDIEQQFASVKAQITTQIPLPTSRPSSPFGNSVLPIAAQPAPKTL